MVRKRHSEGGGDLLSQQFRASKPQQAAKPANMPPLGARPSNGGNIEASQPALLGVVSRVTHRIKSICLKVFLVARQSSTAIWYESFRINGEEAPVDTAVDHCEGMAGTGPSLTQMVE